MKKTMLVLMVLAMAAMIAAPAFAGFDAFDYPNGNLGNNGGWLTNDVGTGWLQVDNGAAKIVGGSAPGERRIGNNIIAGGMTADLIYIDFDIKGSTGGSTGWGLWVYDTSGTNDGAATMVRFYGTSQNVRGRDGDGGSVTAVGNLNVGSWDHVSAILNTVTRSTEVWLNGVSLGSANMAGTAGTTIGRVRLQKLDSGVGEDVWIDNLRVDTTPVITEPVPEPGSMLALGSGLIGMAGFAIRRRRA